MPAPEEIAIDRALTEEVKSRLEDAKAQKNFIREDVEECYFFAAPDRHRSARQTAGTAARREDDAGERYISLPEEMTQDFATEIWGAFFVGEWAKLKTGTAIPTADAAKISEAIQKQNDLVLASIRASNFEAAFMQAMVPDGSIGTIGILIEDVRPDEPIVCQAIPLRECEINLGPFGQVDDRFIVRQVPNRFVLANLPVGTELPAALAKKLKDKPKERTEMRWGFWRDWSDRGNIVWTYTISVGGTVVRANKLKGTGSCPFLVMRINPDPVFPFGYGPLRQTLPEFRALDELTGLTLEHTEQAVHPSWIYPNDGTMNFEGGIIPGMGYPAEKGSSADIKSLFFEGDLDTAWFSEDKLERRIRRAFFVDRPEQSGDTPPSAAQWIDQMALAQRRLAVPAASFWPEGPKEIFQRFLYLLTERGVTEPIKVDGQIFTVEPFNPTERAKDLQEVQTAQQLTGFFQTAAPQVGQLAVNWPATFANVKEKMGDRLVVMMEPAKVEALIGQFASGMAGGEFQNIAKN